MAYLVLARKYRPQRFGEMSGQEHVVRTLSNALARGQLAHAFLFTGPRGVGKTTAARLVAKAVNCERGPTAEPCGTCVPCLEIAEGRSVDVVEIDAASNNGVDNVRDVVEAVKYRPARDRYKVFVIDEVHMLSQGAFNALLKTLEEPPAHVLFVLATTDVHKVPDTIVSRCQRFDFRRLTVQQITDQLAQVAAAEGMTLSPAALGEVARAAAGGMRDALSLLDRVRAAEGDAPSDAAVAEALGVVDGGAVAGLVRALLGRDGPALLAGVAALHERGLELRRVAEALAARLRDVVVARLVPDAPLDLPDAEAAEVRALGAGAEPVQLVRLFDLASRAISAVRLAEQPRHALEVALLEAVFLAPGAEVSALLARAEALAGGTPPAPVPPPAGPAGPGPARTPARTPAPPPRPARAGAPAAADAGAPAAAAPAIDPAAPVADRWRALVAEVEKVTPLAAPALKQATLLWIRDGEVALQLPPGMMTTTVERRRGEIEAVFARALGRPTRLAVQPGEPRPAGAAEAVSIAGADEAARRARSAHVREAVRAHPHIQEAVRILEGGIQKIEEL